MKKLLPLLILVPMFAADPPGFVIWKASDLKAKDKELAGKMSDKKIASETLASYGTHLTMLAHREGDDMIFVDDETKPIINGTGLEDYFLGSWDFGGRDGSMPFSHRFYGAPLIVNPERAGGRYCCYRWHGDNPVTFERYLKYTMEHGHANDRGDNFFSVGYWYQAAPYTDFPAMPPVEARIPKVRTA